MRVGMQVMCQNLGRGREADTAVVQEDIALCDEAVRLGYDSIWATEHHFSGYSMIPNTLVLLSHLAGKHQKVDIGTMCIILPWHDPLRVAGEVAQLDNITGGRLSLGIGRGLGRTEFEGFGIPMEESRARFVESAQLVLGALNDGRSDYQGEFYRSPGREIRPTPTGTFRGRSFAAAVSPESGQIMAELGVGLLISPQKEWPQAVADIDAYRVKYREVNGDAAPAPIFAPKVFCDRDSARAEEVAFNYMRTYFQAVLEHYEMAGTHFAKTKGYEFYAQSAEDAADAVNAVDKYVRLQVLGTPDECLDQISKANDLIGMQAFVGQFGYGDMPAEIATESMRTFAAEVMPELRKMPQVVPPEPALAAS